MTNRQGQTGGARCRLDVSQQEHLRHLLSQQDFWTLARIAQLVQDSFHFSYSHQGLRQLLKRMNLYYYKPQPRDYRQSPLAQEQLQQRLRATVDGLTLRAESLSQLAFGFADEFAPQLHQNRARLWSLWPGKHRSVNTNRVSQSTFGFYALQGQSIVEFMVNGKADTIKTMLQSVRTVNPTAHRIVLIWDNARSHLDQQVQRFAWQLGIYLVALPPYSPNLNPIERIWKSIRYRLSQVGLIDSVTSLQVQIKAIFEELSQSHSFAKSWIEQLLNPLYELSPVLA
ncbi:IS630 family transposase [Spirosoma endbachense]|uniref:IS630 family transposase n=1 Tax=Spirosoma endbachense TaxID=2666025 RepID=A0A6P1VTY2_9BACT|nr:IS630 family transposase [Spirosoma endbachense]QHV96543.1 IS630 family transposase [Spirosoma endbachense]